MLQQKWLYRAVLKFSDAREHTCILDKGQSLVFGKTKDQRPGFLIFPKTGLWNFQRLVFGKTKNQRPVFGKSKNPRPKTGLW